MAEPTRKAAGWLWFLASVVGCCITPSSARKLSGFLQGSFPLLLTALWLLLVVGFVFIVVAVSTGLFNEFLQGSFPLLLTALSLLLVVGFVFIVVAVSTGLFNEFLQALS